MGEGRRCCYVKAAAPSQLLKEFTAAPVLWGRGAPRASGSACAEAGLQVGPLLPQRRSHTAVMLEAPVCVTGNWTEWHRCASCAVLGTWAALCILCPPFSLKGGFGCCPSPPTPFCSTCNPCLLINPDTGLSQVCPFPSAHVFTKLPFTWLPRAVLPIGVLNFSAPFSCQWSEMGVF